MPKSRSEKRMPKGSKMSEKGTNMEPKIHLKWRRDAGNGDDWGGLGPKRCPKIFVIVVWQCMEYYLKRWQEGEGG